MNTRLIAAVILGSLMLAGCGGGSSDTAQDEADMQVADAQQERIDELEEDLAAAQEQARLEQAAREREQAEKERLEREAEEAEARANRAEAGRAYGDLFTSAGTVAVTPKYRAKATVNTPAMNFESSSLSSSGRWSITAFSNAGSDNNDDLVVYADMDAPTNVKIVEHAVHADNFEPVLDTNNIVATLRGSSTLISSSRFPGGGRSTTFEHNFDSEPTMDAPDDGDADTTTDGDGNTRNDYDRTRFSGSFDGASGTFECMGTCTIKHEGGDLYDIESGTWTFTTSNTATVKVADDSYMYFGWWKREAKSDGSLSFSTFSAGQHPVTEIPIALTGTATYTGPAVGQYAIYQPAGSDSGTGSFTARAELTANFGDNTGNEGMLSGRVTNFSNAADWSLTLMSQEIVDGGVARPDNPATDPSVSWTIAGNTVAGGGWYARFFSDVAPYAGHIPEGVAGTFNAEFGTVGRLVGAFGAHCPTSTCPRD